ncbi:hypothetical protein SVIO_092700 [Streptomyces violaceusniger]|uniref:AAA+ ATPase domain-containing protein n=1 Tax=Streptomyces violaceusniger TaxID=68280 RepID=A0A4D4LJR8_STRVO|nr:hypothetical protein SVIO_092700 [Streptomyces violaceusniger]
MSDTMSAPTSDPANTPLLEVEDLQIELITDGGVVRAVDGVGFTIGPGETVTIIGESGSGKSTTAMGLLRLLPEGLAVLSGTARIFGSDVIADATAAGRIRGRGVSLIPQDPMTALSPVHTIGRQLGEAIRLRHPGMSRADARAKGVELLGQVRIPRPRPAGAPTPTSSPAACSSASSSPSPWPPSPGCWWPTSRPRRSTSPSRRASSTC